MQNSLLSEQCCEPLALQEVMDLRAAAPLAARLLAAQGSSLVLDGSKVRRIGAQCMQLIVSAHLTWERDGLNLTLARASAELVEAFEIAGIKIDGLMEKEPTQ